MKVHLVNPMRNPAGGSEARTISLLEIIGETEDVHIWSEEPPNPAFLGKVPISRIGPPNRFPVGGNVAFVGTYFSIGRWIAHAEPNRVILIHNLDQPDRLRYMYNALANLPLPKPEVVYASKTIASSTPDIPGVIQESPIDIDSFKPSEAPHEGFVVGKLCRDVTDKHHPGDPALYRRLADSGIKVRLMGATCLGELGTGIETHPECTLPAPTFLAGLDVFYYRTHPRWLEAFGRVVFEAMAAGIPVVAEARHGYAERLTSGHDCLLIPNETDGFDEILRLKNDPKFRALISANGRRTVERIYGDSFRAEVRDFYAS